MNMLTAGRKEEKEVKSEHSNTTTKLAEKIIKVQLMLTRIVLGF